MSFRKSFKDDPRQKLMENHVIWLRIRHTYSYNLENIQNAPNIQWLWLGQMADLEISARNMALNSN